MLTFKISNILLLGLLPKSVMAYTATVRVHVEITRKLSLQPKTKEMLFLILRVFGARGQGVNFAPQKHRPAPQKHWQIMKERPFGAPLFKGRLKDQQNYPQLPIRLTKSSEIIILAPPSRGGGAKNFKK
jgi:hypothetical protein